MTFKKRRPFNDLKLNWRMALQDVENAKNGNKEKERCDGTER